MRRDQKQNQKQSGAKKETGSIFSGARDTETDGATEIYGEATRESEVAEGQRPSGEGEETIRCNPTSNCALPRPIPVGRGALKLAGDPDKASSGILLKNGTHGASWSPRSKVKEPMEQAVAPDQLYIRFRSFTAQKASYRCLYSVFIQKVVCSKLFLGCHVVAIQKIHQKAAD